MTMLVMEMRAKQMRTSDVREGLVIIVTATNIVVLVFSCVFSAAS